MVFWQFVAACPLCWKLYLNFSIEQWNAHSTDIHAALKVTLPISFLLLAVTLISTWHCRVAFLGSVYYNTVGAGVSPALCRFDQMCTITSKGTASNLRSSRSCKIKFLGFELNVLLKLVFKTILYLGIQCFANAKDSGEKKVEIGWQNKWHSPLSSVIPTKKLAEW